MRIDTLIVENFKGFVSREFSFHPNFNLIVGENATGKTSVLDALSIAAGSWFLGLRGHDSRQIRSEEVRLQGYPLADSHQVWERHYPCSVTARGSVLDKSLSWTRSLNNPQGRTTTGGARDLKSLASRTDSDVRSGKPVVLPLISYYGTGRLWNVPREQAQVHEQPAPSKTELSRLAGYRNSVDPRLSVSELMAWIARQSWVTFQQQGQDLPAYRAVRDALVRNTSGAQTVTFDAQLGEVVVDFETGARQPFNNLSDGQRCMLALVGDIAFKAATLNPHLGANALDGTPGIVLIDELDLHLHPKWQRSVIESLRTTFPQVQFVCTTHSPFLIQSLRPGELINLDESELAEYADRSIEDIAEHVMGVELPQKSERYLQMMEAAEEYYRLLRQPTAAAESVRAAEERLSELSAPFSDDPAFQALLKLERETQRGGADDATGG